MDTAIRTLRLHTTRGGGPMPLAIPVQQEVERDLDAPIPKELCLPSLDRGMLGSWNRKKESRMAVAKNKEGKSPQK